ncbi:MAG: RNA polymerase sigma-70 factor [Cyclobacteriaceae bacterium]
MEATMASGNIDNEDLLVEQLHKGDKQAFQKLYLKYIDRIYSFTLSICKSPELSRDVCHDIFTKIWENRRELNAKLSFKSFLYTSCRNHVLNIIKRAANESTIYEEIVANMSMDSSSKLEDDLMHKEAKMLLNEAVGQLSPQRKKIFELSREAGLSHHEIAQQLGISKGTVNVQMVKALQSIKEYLIQNGHYSPILILSTLIFS